MQNVKRDFWLEPGGPKRLMVEYEPRLQNAQVMFDGQRVITFANQAEFTRGATCKLPDGSLLTAKYGPIAGAEWLRVLKGIHLIRNGVPVPGSAAEPLQKWTWAFVVGCGIICFFGGAIPALIGFGGTTGVMAVARNTRWTIGKRIGACAGITLACWVGVLALAVTVARLKGGSQETTVSVANTGNVKNRVPLTHNEELLHEIAVTYYQHGYMTSDVASKKEYLADRCDTMPEDQCADYLSQELVTAKRSSQVK
jgi:hypothetical protein